MSGTGIKKWIVIFAHGLAGWALCGAIIGVGRSVTSMENTLVIHAAGVPVIFGVISWVYHRKFHYTGSAVTALVFTLLAIVMDAGLVAPVFEKSYAMFESVLGTWIPFCLIFAAAYLAGRAAGKRR
jgi:hypothetical protein